MWFYSRIQMFASSSLTAPRLATTWASALPRETSTHPTAAILTSAPWNSSGGKFFAELPAEREACVARMRRGGLRQGGLPMWFIFKGERWECVERLRSWESSPCSGLGFTSPGHCRGFGVKSWGGGGGQDLVFRQQHKHSRIFTSVCVCVCACALVCLCFMCKGGKKKKKCKNQTELQQNREVAVHANWHIDAVHFPIFQQARR